MLGRKTTSLLERLEKHILKKIYFIELYFNWNILYLSTDSKTRSMNAVFLVIKKRLLPLSSYSK